MLAESHLVDLPLLPLERGGGLVVGRDEGIDAAAHLVGRGMARAVERATLQDAEPDLDLVEPARVGGGEMEVDVAVTGQPAIVLGLVGREVVEDDVDLEVGLGMGSETSFMKSRNSRRRRRRVWRCWTSPLATSRAANSVVVPCRLYSWAKPVSARPSGSRSQPWARSRAWMPGFSSTESTSAFSGGSRYSPTTSAALVANSGSVLMHQLRRRRRLMPWRRRVRQTWSALTSPRCAASSDPVQLPSQPRGAPSSAARTRRVVLHPVLAR